MTRRDFFRNVALTVGAVAVSRIPTLPATAVAPAAVAPAGMPETRAASVRRRADGHGYEHVHSYPFCRCDHRHEPFCAYCGNWHR